MFLYDYASYILVLFLLLILMVWAGLGTIFSARLLLINTRIIHRMLYAVRTRGTLYSLQVRIERYEYVSYNTIRTAVVQAPSRSAGIKVKSSTAQPALRYSLGVVYRNNSSFDQLLLEGKIKI